MPRNVLLHIADQCRADALGCYGNPHGVTPNLDRLAADGCRFNNAYTVTAQCTPAPIRVSTERHHSRGCGLPGGR